MGKHAVDGSCEHGACGFNLLIDVACALCDKCRRGKGFQWNERRNGDRWIHFRTRHINKRGHCYAPCGAGTVWEMIHNLYPNELSEMNHVS